MPTPRNSTRPDSQIGRWICLRLVAEQEVRDRHRHQHEADREQHLIERARAVKPAIERPLQGDADRRRDDESERQREEERNAPRFISNAVT